MQTLLIVQKLSPACSHKTPVPSESTNEEQERKCVYKPKSSLLEIDGVGACVGVFLGLEIVQGHPKLAQDCVSKVFKLACMQKHTWIGPEERSYQNHGHFFNHQISVARSHGDILEDRQITVLKTLSITVMLWNLQERMQQTLTNHFLFHLFSPLLHDWLQPPDSCSITTIAGVKRD